MIAAGDLLQTRICTPRCVSCVNQTDEFLLVFIHSEKKKGESKWRHYVPPPPLFFFLKIPARDRYHWMALNFIFCVSRHNDDLRNLQNPHWSLWAFISPLTRNLQFPFHEKVKPTHTHTHAKKQKKRQCESR